MVKEKSEFYFPFFENKAIPSVSTISKFVKIFESVASVAVRKNYANNNNNNKIRHNKINKTIIIAIINQNPKYGIKPIATECELHHSLLLRILKKKNMKYVV